MFNIAIYCPNAEVMYLITNMWIYSWALCLHIACSNLTTVPHSMPSHWDFCRTELKPEKCHPCFQVRLTCNHSVFCKVTDGFPNKNHMVTLQLLSAPVTEDWGRNCMWRHLNFKTWIGTLRSSEASKELIFKFSARTDISFRSSRICLYITIFSILKIT